MSNEFAGPSIDAEVIFNVQWLHTERGTAVIDNDPRWASKWLHPGRYSDLGILLIYSAKVSTGFRLKPPFFAHNRKKWTDIVHAIRYPTYAAHHHWYVELLCRAGLFTVCCAVA
jgi:hypothetical protein